MDDVGRGSPVTGRSRGVTSHHLKSAVFMPVSLIRFNCSRQSTLVVSVPQIRPSVQNIGAAQKTSVFSHALSHHIIWTVSYVVGRPEVLFTFLALSASLPLKQPIYKALLPSMKHGSA